MSTTWVALLRGINLGPHKRVAMADLRALLEALGFEDVRTHLQSGNAIFTAGRGTASKVERAIASGISDDLGLDVTVLVRSAAELDAVVDANPLTRKRAGAKSLHAVFLDRRPDEATTARVRKDRGRFAPDDFAFGDRVIYVGLARGVMGSRLPNWEKLLGVRATMRTWNVVTRLRDLALEQMGGRR